MRIAIIGTGIAGNAAAYGLSAGAGHQITVYERDVRPGGHSATVDIEHDGVRMAVDTGFIVYNEMNYPNFTAMLAHLGVETVASDMSFAVSARDGAFEWCGRTTDVLNGIFAQRSNLASPGFLRMLFEVRRFNRIAIEDLEAGRLAGTTLGAYLDRMGFSARFRDDYLIPMGAAIWSMSPAAMLSFPARSFVSFFRNHHLLQWERPVWRTVAGGSRRYVEALQRPFRDHVRLGARVTEVLRHKGHVEVADSSGGRERFDHVVFACHSDEALEVLADASPAEASVLSRIRFRGNDVYLHRDPCLMPRRKRAWASWNVMQGADPNADLCVTYWMNLLQSLDRSRTVLITLNPSEPPHPELTFARFNYAHPQYDEGAIAAQEELPAIQGRNRTWFCGAWTGHGFHEDGLVSGIAVAEELGGSFPWRAQPRHLAEAAE
jgi:predicted NAD/FAD-binding protein